jgi:hypothetical protein
VSDRGTGTSLLRRISWHLRFAWCAFLGLDFESDRVQALVAERFWRDV